MKVQKSYYYNRDIIGNIINITKLIYNSLFFLTIKSKDIKKVIHTNLQLFLHQITIHVFGAFTLLRLC